jgi:NTE family protein
MNAEQVQIARQKQDENAWTDYKFGKWRGVYRHRARIASLNVSRRPLVGLALGSGSARGWAHVGVIRALEQAGIVPDLVCGASIGALVGAAYAAGELDRFEQWLLGMRVKEVFGLVDLSLNGGMLKGERLMDFFRRSFVDRPINELDIPFAAVSTVLNTGTEVCLRDGSTVEAVRASIAFPALFTPVLRDGVLLVDGGLVNPVPVSLARAMGAEIVIAVDLSSDILGCHRPPVTRVADSKSSIEKWIRKLQEKLGGLIPSRPPDEYRPPSLSEVMASSINIMQVRITRSCMAGVPPDLIISPRLAHLGLFDYHCAKEAIEEGKRAADAILHNLRVFDNHPL